MQQKQCKVGNLQLNAYIKKEKGLKPTLFHILQKYTNNKLIQSQMKEENDKDQSREK